MRRALTGRLSAPVGWLALLLALGACDKRPPTATPPASQPPAASTATREPTAVVTPRAVESNGVRLVIPFADTDIRASQVAAVGNPGAASSRMPAHTRFMFRPFLPDLFSNQIFAVEPQILIIPTDDFASLGFAQQQDLLQALVRSRIDLSAETELPYLPPTGAAQVFHAQESHLAFANGSGIRYLTRYAHDASPFGQKDIFYTFQGVTDDGRFYVAATFPLIADALPASIGAAERSAAAANYESYLLTTVGLLNQADPDLDFAPALSQLDAMIESLEVRTP